MGRDGARRPLRDAAARVAVTGIRVLGVARYLTRLLKTKIDPHGYARAIGVNLGDDVHFYGMRPGMFGTEPWLIRIGSHVHITGGCQFITHDGGTLVLRHREPTLEITAPIVVGDYVYIGMNSTVLAGVTIGNNVVIGAGSMVTKDIPPGMVVAGVPAKVIKPTDVYFEELKSRSLGLGHLNAKDKERELRQLFAAFIEHGPRPCSGPTEDPRTGETEGL